MNGRLVWVDWLKGLVVLGVVAFHAAQPFVLTDWLVNAREESLLLSGLAGLGYLFAMPLMFLLAGLSSFIALERRTVRQYLGVRLLRLGVPLIVGLLLLSPFESWIGWLSHGGSPDLAWLWSHLSSSFEVGLTPLWLGEYGHHLWFLGFVLAYVLLTLPLLVWLRAQPRPSAAHSVAASLVLIAPVVPLALLQWVARPAAPAYRDWADALLWLCYFGLGVAVAFDRRLIAPIGRLGGWLVVPAFVMAIALIPAGLDGTLLALESSPSADLVGLGYAIARAAIGWFLVCAALALGIRALNGRQVWAHRAGEASMAAYFLHHPIVVVIAALVVPLGLGWLPGFALILAGSLAVLAVVYEGGVRRIPLLRAVFGVGEPHDSPSDDVRPRHAELRRPVT